MEHQGSRPFCCLVVSAPEPQKLERLYRDSSGGSRGSAGNSGHVSQRSKEGLWSSFGVQTSS